MDRLRAFEIFVTVVSRGSFTRAADALKTSPANVTRYVNELETHLGTRLLNRSSRKISLTESGRRSTSGVNPSWRRWKRRSRSLRPRRCIRAGGCASMLR